MSLQQTIKFQHLFAPAREKIVKNVPLCASATTSKRMQRNTKVSSSGMGSFSLLSTNFPKSPFLSRGLVVFKRSRIRASRIEETVKSDDERTEGGEKSSKSEGEDDPFLMDEDERREWRRKIREVIDKHPDVEEEAVPEERRRKIQNLLADYPLLVEEDDPDWPEDADGFGFNLGQFFNKITIKNVKKDDDENYDSENELAWQDDDYIRLIKDITTAEWEETVFKDISPLIVLVHNRYRRPKENQKIRDELERAVQIIWNCRLPSPRQFEQQMTCQK